MGIFKRLFGICDTQVPTNEGCWRYEDGAITVDLQRVPELASNGGAIRLEGKNAPVRVLLLRGEDNELHAFKNRCTHGGRRLDPLSGEGNVQCCSVGKSTFNYSGQLQGGSAKNDITVYSVEVQDNTAVIHID